MVPQLHMNSSLFAVCNTIDNTYLSLIQTVSGIQTEGIYRKAGIHSKISNLLAEFLKGEMTTSSMNYSVMEFEFKG